MTDALLADLEAFAGLLEAEWYNGNIDESAYLRLNRDLGGVIAKHRQLSLPVQVSWGEGAPATLPPTSTLEGTP